MIDLMREEKKLRTGNATQKLAELKSRGEDLFYTMFSVAELYVGVNKGDRPVQEAEQIEACLAQFKLLEFGLNAAKLCGATVGQLEKRGETISDMDSLIASVALDAQQVVVTRNARHLGRVPGLTVETYD